MWSNCIIETLKRFFKEGGYVAIRRSRLGVFPHMIWIKDLKNAEIEHFVPTNAVYKLIPPPVFKGFIARTDKIDELASLTEQYSQSQASSPQD